MVDHQSLMNDKEFWYKLRVDYDEVKTREGDFLTNLVSEFFKGKKSHVEQLVGDPEKFMEGVAKLSTEKLIQTLLTIYVNHLWDQNKTGETFISSPGSDVKTELASAFLDMKAQGDTIVETIGDNHIVWTVERTLVDESDRNIERVIGRQILAAQPSLIRIFDANHFEIRGRKKNLNIIKQRLVERKTLSIVTPEKEAKAIVEAFSGIIERKNPLFDIVGIRYLESNLPNKSKLILRNDRGVAEDIREMERTNIVAPSAFTDISTIELRIKKIGKSIKLRIRHFDEGFAFEIDDKKMLESERKEVKRMLETLGVSFDKIYDYTSQYDARFIFHKILSGSVRVYEKYFDSMDEKTKKILDEIIELVTEEKRKCESCEREFDKGTTCPHCASQHIRTIRGREIHIKEETVYGLLSHKIRSATKTFSSRTTNVRIDQTELSKKKVLRLSFTKLEVAGKASFSRHYDFYVCPIGSGRLPSRVNDYLLDAVLILYGDGYFRRGSYSEFGFVGLYQMLFSNSGDVASAIEGAIDVAIRLDEDRVVSAATDAEKTITWVLESGVSTIKYKPKDFERDVFYLLKRMFPHSERWGREGQRESDGIIALSAKGDTYFVASYDPKLTADESGYDLNAEQQNKTAYYILSENLNERIRPLTGDKSINAHIIISNAFRLSSVQSFGAAVSKWIRLVDSEEHSLVRVPIILLPLEELIDLYKLFNEHWDLIKGNAQFHRKFLEYVTNMFRTEEHCLLISRGHLDKLRESVIELKRTTKLTQPIALI